MPTRAYYFPCLGAHPCADDTCSLGGSRRTTRTPWTTGWSTSIFSYVSSHPHSIRCPPVPTIFSVSMPTPAPTHVLWAAAAVLPVHPGLQAGARLHDPALPHPLLPRQPTRINYEALAFLAVVGTGFIPTLPLATQLEERLGGQESKIALLFEIKLTGGV